MRRKFESDGADGKHSSGLLRSMFSHTVGMLVSRPRLYPLTRDGMTRGSCDAHVRGLQVAFEVFILQKSPATSLTTIRLSHVPLLEERNELFFLRMVCRLTLSRSGPHGQDGTEQGSDIGERWPIVLDDVSKRSLWNQRENHSGNVSCMLHQQPEDAIRNHPPVRLCLTIISWSHGLFSTRITYPADPFMLCSNDIDTTTSYTDRPHRTACDEGSPVPIPSFPLPRDSS
ncbi:hypothetical protein BC629DRAFT_349284 [Irpex lacteus]|nr:hypothetical protein BC629DRAFT_349284 [Irpex lacteus]